ncbi:MAG TPA: TonB family protein [Bryobacteraceae bacterium]|nr:TonB family protein [Bryobacteraceae bacterium]
MAGRFRPAPFAFSLLIHGSILGWVASGPVYEKPKSLYTLEIKPHISKVIWYDFRQKLPDVSPEPKPAPAPVKPPRAETKIASQEIVAGPPKAPHAPQLIWQPAPKVALSKELKSPNLLSIHVPRPEAPPKPKLFVPPPEAAKAAPEAPKIDAPPLIRASEDLSARAPATKLARVPPRNFVAPADHPVQKREPALPVPEAIQTVAHTGAAPAALGSAPRPVPRDFVAPPASAPSSPSNTPLPAAPALPESGQPATVSMAIVGLNPSTNAPAPSPEGSRNAQFSAGPEPRKTGALSGASDHALLTVPGLMIRNATPDNQPILTARAAAPTSMANLRAAVRGNLPETGAGNGSRLNAIRVTSAPDSWLNGRETYQMMVQMPNVTSYTGSWMIWFAERQPAPGMSPRVLSPPVPLRKVDPKYYPAAMADRVEGIVRLTAVIRPDGHVDSVELLMHLDDRLDKSSEEALGKWEFEPALLNGKPIAVDAVFEIPFRLAPKVPK